MKASEVTLKNLADYLRVESGQYTDAELQMMLDAALAYMRSYTGLTIEELDKHEDFAVVVFVLVQDMYDNRSMYVDKNNLNAVVETILGMHRRNLLPEAVKTIC